ncbi:hypothetical protein [Trueperella pecoris]|uniref:Uncharacterized protein n=1 Tax=Trueperella pecoris TaxID=2733571 RepID=A0A7M1QX77_9ACTO|nr:hypothetical protein [Trueperella pecoris]QOQ38941.1 hypothetical protein HLG82_05455 [Trueperella pecoris]QOR46431.1 hypothetical protein INS88_04330 [Trueperella pecoris]QTG76257.1 hypothetical protein J4179_04260 [Trueperella pecoris]
MDVQAWKAWLMAFAAIMGFAAGLANDRTDWKAYAQQLVNTRNEALVSGDWETLAALTIEESAARAEDARLIEWMKRNDVNVEAVSTQIVSVDVVSRRGPVLDVVSHQRGAYLAGDEGSHTGDRLCRRWYLNEGRLEEIRPCQDE